MEWILLVVNTWARRLARVPCFAVLEHFPIILVHILS